MELGAFHASLRAARELGLLVDLGARDIRDLTKIGLSVDVLAAAKSGAIVLSVARFEEFLRSVAERTLQMYSRAQPPVVRSQLDIELQLTIMRRNIAAATRAAVHGVDRDSDEIRRDVHDVAQRIAQDQIWGDHAIDTHSNPNSKTVKEVFSLLGIPGAWAKIEAAFAPLWTAHQQVESGHKAIPSAAKELESILLWRNQCAHTSQTPLVGAHEIAETIAYFEALSTAMEDVLRTAVVSRIASLQSTPAAWV